MNYYLVASGYQTTHVENIPERGMGGVGFRQVQVADGFRWEIAGVFAANNAEAACKAAAKKSGRMGNFFAIEGFPWGVEMIDTEDAVEFGGADSMNKIQKLENRSRELEVEVGIE